MDSAAFGRPYSRHRVCFLFLRVLRCFLSPRSRSPKGASPKGQDIPFGNPGFYGSMRLPRAFRSLARPSSAPEPSHPPAGILAGNAGPGLYPGVSLCTASHSLSVSLSRQPFPDDSTSPGAPAAQQLWTRRDLNPRPPPRKGGALPAELRAQRVLGSASIWTPAGGAGCSVRR